MPLFPFLQTDNVVEVSRNDRSAAEEFEGMFNIIYYRFFIYISNLTCRQPGWNELNFISLDTEATLLLSK